MKTKKQALTDLVPEDKLWEFLKDIIEIHESDPKAITIQTISNDEGLKNRFIFQCPGTDEVQQTDTFDLKFKTLLSEKESAEYCQATIDTIQMWSDQGWLPHTRFRDQLLFVGLVCVLR